MIRKIIAFGRDLWTLVMPYWRSEERWVSGALLAGAFCLNLSGVYYTVLYNDWQRLFYNSLQDVNFAEFVHQLIRYFVLGLVWMFIRTYQNYFRQLVEIRWRRWLSSRYAGAWLKERAYYRLRFAFVGVDNPDQRIAEDLRELPDQTLGMIFGFISAMGSLGAFAAILWDLSRGYIVCGIEIPGLLLWAVLLYSLVGTWLTNLVGRPLIGFKREQQQFEADYRFDLVRLRENAEGIAAYQGEEREKQNLSSRFARIMTNWRNIMHREIRLGYFMFGFSKVTDIFPYLVIAPRFFAGAIQLGEMVQAKNAFDRVENSLCWFAYQYRNLANWKAVVDRLIGFEQALQEVAADLPPGLTRREVPVGEGICLEGFDLYRPDNTAIFQGVNIYFSPGSRTLVSGPSGCGKTTFFHAINGLWPYCRGNIRLPVGCRMLYLPQRPYLPIATLRQAVVYPAPADAYEDDIIRWTLADCGLDRLGDRLDEEVHWDQQLSPGEQQRLAFARALLIRPQWLFLDEATSALDETNEERLYRLLIDRLPGTAIVSIAHRSTVMRYHEHRLDFDRLINGDVNLKCAER